MNNVHCQNDVDMFFDAFKELAEAKPFAMREQYILLNRFSVPVIAKISQLCGLIPTQTKQITIGNIVKQYFTKFYLGLLEMNRSHSIQLTEAENEITNWGPRTPELHILRGEMLSLIGEYYKHCFYVKKNKVNQQQQHITTVA